MIAALQQVKPKSKTQQGEQILVPNEPIWPLTVSQYHTMIETGILTEDDPVELLEGWLVYKMPKNPEHIFVARETSDALKAIVPSGWYINVQDPVTMETSEPEPDIVVIRGTRRDFSRQTPTAKDVSLLVEVSEATLGRDRGTKSACMPDLAFQFIGLSTCLTTRLRCIRFQQTMVKGLIIRVNRFSL